LPGPGLRRSPDARSVAWRPQLQIRRSFGLSKDRPWPPCHSRRLDRGARRLPARLMKTRAACAARFMREMAEQLLCGRKHFIGTRLLLENERIAPFGNLL